MVCNDFEVTYKFSTVLHFILLFDSLFFCFLFSCFLYLILDEYVFLKVVCAFLFLGSAVLFFYCVKGIFLWFGKDNSLKIKNKKFYCYKGFFSRRRCVVDLEMVSNASVSNWGVGERKILKIFVDKDVYAISDSFLGEQDFSRLCNVFVKFSRRCKACQSDMVEWEGGRGHCHSCETITPLLVDDFDWGYAYQA